MSEFLIDLKRTHDCGALRGADAGKRAVLFGWVAARRDHGGCVFIDLRDRGGLTQIVFEPDRKSTRLNSSHGYISYAVFCLKKKPTAFQPEAQHRAPPAYGHVTADQHVR